MSDKIEISLAFEGASNEADLVNNILEDCGIVTLVKNRNMGRLFPYYASHGGIQPVQIYVKSSDLEQARDIIKAYFSDTAQ